MKKSYKVIGDTRVLIKDKKSPNNYRSTKVDGYFRNKNVILPLNEFLDNLGW